MWPGRHRCRAAGPPPPKGVACLPRTWAGSAGSSGTEQGVGMLQAVMGQTSPPTEVKANEEMRQAWRHGVKTPASSYKLRPWLHSVPVASLSPSPHSAPPFPTVLDRKDTCVSRGCPGWSPQPPWVAHPSVRWAGWSAE